MIESIAQVGTELQADELYAAYSIAIAKKAMEVSEASAEALLAQMLPEQQNVAMPTHSVPPVSLEPHLIDTYA